MSKAKKACILCNNESKLVKTECCNVWLCTGREDNACNVNAGPNSNNCNANHNQFTLCSIHHNQKHKEQDWRKCEKCKEAFQVQIYTWLGTNQYNHVKLEDSAKIEPTHCKCCKKVINLDADGFIQKSDGSIHCKKCENIMIIEASTPKPSPAKGATQSPKKPKSPISKPVILTPSKSENKPKKHKYKGLTSLQIIEALKTEITHKFGKASTSTSRSVTTTTKRPARPKSLDVQSLDKKTKRAPRSRARSMSKDSTKREENALQPTERLSFISLPCGERKPSNLRPYSMYQGRSNSGKKKLKSPVAKSNKRVSFNLIPQPPWQPSFSQPAVLPSMSAPKNEGTAATAKDLKRKPDRSSVVVEKGRSPSPTADQKRKRVKKNDQTLDPNSNEQKVTIVLNKKKTPIPSPNKPSTSAEKNPSSSGSKKKVQGTTKKMNIEESKPILLA